MNFQELNAQWKAQQEKFQEWRIALLRAAFAVSKEAEAILNPPSGWTHHETKQEHKYVEIMSGVNNEMSPLAFGNMEITDNGEGLFCLCITFDHGVNTYPKRRHHAVAAVRFQKGQPEYCRWDSRENQPGSEWQSDAKSFAEQLVQLFADSFSLDPFEGCTRPKVGFF